MRSSRGYMVAVGAGVLALSVAVAWEWPRIPVHHRCRRLDKARTLSAAKPLLVALAKDMRDPWARELVLGKLSARRQYLTFWVFFHVLADRADHSLVHGLGRRLERSQELRAMWSHYLRWRGFPPMTVVVETPGRLPSASVDGIYTASYLPFSLMVLHRYTSRLPAPHGESMPPSVIPFPRWQGAVPELLDNGPFAEDLLVPLSPP